MATARLWCRVPAAVPMPDAPLQVSIYEAMNMVVRHLQAHPTESSGGVMAKMAREAWFTSVLQRCYSCRY